MKYLILVTIVLLSVGCRPKPYTHHAESPIIGKVVTGATGSIFYNKEERTGTRLRIWGQPDSVRSISSYKIELSIASVSAREFSLYYKEYTAGNSSGSWLIKSGFTQRYDYDMTKTNKFIFRKLKFEILGISDDGVVKYKRIK